jgi:hypothetical protein
MRAAVFDCDSLDDLADAEGRLKDLSQSVGRDSAKALGRLWFGREGAGEILRLISELRDAGSHMDASSPDGQVQKKPCDPV